MLAIIDYGMGNLRSVQKAFERVGLAAQIVNTAAQVEQASKLVLPGVGAFADAARELRTRGLVRPILDFIARGHPFLGICLGLQLLFDVSYEDGEHTGLGVIRGKVVPFAFDPSPATRPLKVPHMGWNRVHWDRANPLVNGLADGSHMYFVHSLCVVPVDRDVWTAECDYGGLFTCMVGRDNVFATQFHPEKSQDIGLKMLANFARL